MRPIIDRQAFVNATDDDLVKMIAEPSDLNDDQLLNDAKGELILRRLDICTLFNSIEFTIESYGTINFLIDYASEIPDLLRLAELVKEFEMSDIVDAVQKTMAFYTQNEERIAYLRGCPEDYDEKQQQLHEEYISLEKPQRGVWYHIPLHYGIQRLAKYIRQNPDEFCLDQNGQSLRNAL